MNCNRKRVEHPDNSFYGYSYGRVFDNGALEYAFLPNTGLPVVQFVGAGFSVGGMRSLMPAPLNMSAKRTTVAGIPTQAGQYILQPLISG
jgi:hypothetical protein